MESGNVMCLPMGITIILYKSSNKDSDPNKGGEADNIHSSAAKLKLKQEPNDLVCLIKRLMKRKLLGHNDVEPLIQQKNRQKILRSWHVRAERFATPFAPKDNT